MNPQLMEALQVSKYILKQDRMDFTAGWITGEDQMLLDPDEGPLDISDELIAELRDQSDAAE